MINQNRPIDINKLYKLAKRELKFKSDTLFHIIKVLFHEGYIIEGSKLIRQELLKNPYRAIIYRFIKLHPGVNFSTIKKFAFSKEDDKVKSILNEKSEDFGSSGQFIWHLEVLLKFKCVKKIEFGNFSLFVPFEMDEYLAKYYFLLRDNINRKILDLVLDKGKIKQANIPKFFEIPRGTIYYHIKIMLEEKMIFSEKINDKMHISLNFERKPILLDIKKNIELELLKVREIYKSTLKTSEEKIKTEKQRITDDIIPQETKEELKIKPKEELKIDFEKENNDKEEDSIEKSKKRRIQII